MPTTLNSNTLSGMASSHSKTDTIITNDLLVRTSLQECIDNTLPGFVYQYLPPEEFADSMGRFDLTSINEKHHADILINLKELSVKIIGETNKGTSVVMSQPMMEMPGIYSSMSPVSNFHGNIFMDYIAVWEITNVREDQKMEIRQKGRYVSKYHKKYSLYEEIMTSAKLAGKNFSVLLTEAADKTRCHE